ncbi:class I SAM-dependent methyltransferase [Alicyclobacillus suci]|uniref:class I SAM-dependent methyltransferase n=1 Tax=Alicyclobacillus suci TaxID=2816080 RepID=UPI001A8C13CD|nr:methyltransferase domain-containing protein [Alicyclobacillus suci]
MSERDRKLKLDSEQEAWEEKYRRREEKLFASDAFLVARRHQLQEGTVLDVACGDGRNALYLARHGFTVTGVDFSREALRRLAHFSEAEGFDSYGEYLSLFNRRR